MISPVSFTKGLAMGRSRPLGRLCEGLANEDDYNLKSNK